MTLVSLLKSASQKLFDAGTPNDQAWFEAEMLLAHVLKRDRVWLLAHQETVIAKRQVVTFTKLITRRVQREPLAYLLNACPFFGETFFVDKRVLIPRPETEMIVERGIDTLSRKPSLIPSLIRAGGQEFQNPSLIRDLFPWDGNNQGWVSDGKALSSPLLWDVGTGSGAIAVSVKKHFPRASVLASDISAASLVVAKKNARRICHGGITFMRANLFDRSVKQRFKKARASSFLILANLPYLPNSDKKKLAKDVVAFEPAHALFAEEEGRSLNERLLEQLAAFQAKDGRAIRILMEFDPPQAKTLAKVAKRFFPFAKISILEDHCDRPRVLDVVVDAGAKPAKMRSSVVT